MKIAIIGSGISGLGAAFILNPTHDITLYEKNAYLGGHSRTLDVPTQDGLIPVDTGFIVFNYRNYPHLTGMFDLLNVPVEKSDMSFGASIANGWLEYATRSPSAMFAQLSNVANPKFLKMTADILKFNRQALSYLDKDESITLGQALDELGMGQWFRDYFILAVGGAIWSTSVQQMLAFPAKTFVRFFDNHGLLSVNDQPQWFTVTGGSREYVKRLSASFADKAHTNRGVATVERTPEGVIVTDEHGQADTYDQVIFACHSDQAAKMLSNPTEIERDIIGSVAYHPNKVVLHKDKSFMPKRRSVWSSWVYLSEDRTDARDSVSLSYWMNRLQNLDTSEDIIVTLNPHKAPDRDLVINEHVFEHPVFDTAAINAQSRLDEIQGKDRIWWCGAWQRYGFHEDGLLSAVNVCKKMDATIPWS